MVKEHCKNCMALEAEIEKILEGVETLLQNIQAERPKAHLAIVHDIRKNHKEEPDET